jgi:hypothetical protein
MCAAVVGLERNIEFAPERGRFVKLDPRHAKDDRVASETRDIELDALSMGTDLELERKGLVGDVAGGSGMSIGKHQRSRRGLDTEADGVGLGKGGIDEGRSGATVDQGDGLD